jgi:hypothetical protein
MLGTDPFNDEFCRRFILPDDKLNVADVVASYPNTNAANPSKGRVFSLTDSNSPLNQRRQASHDWVLKLLPTVLPITLPIMAPAANSENQWIVTETASPM